MDVWVWRTGFSEVWQCSLMSNETPSAAASKPWFLSKTFWANLLMSLSLVFPAVQGWAAENPTAMPIIFAFVNLVLRSVTKQAITISSSDGVAGSSGGSVGVLPLGLFLCCAACLLLPSCTNYPVEGSVMYRDPESGAKGGLVFVPGEKPKGFLSVPIYDPETGAVVGQATLNGRISGTK